MFRSLVARLKRWMEAHTGLEFEVRSRIIPKIRELVPQLDNEDEAWLLERWRLEPKIVEECLGPVEISTESLLAILRPPLSTFLWDSKRGWTPTTSCRQKFNGLVKLDLELHECTKCGELLPPECVNFTDQVRGDEFRPEMLSHTILRSEERRCICRECPVLQSEVAQLERAAKGWIFPELRARLGPDYSNELESELLKRMVGVTMAEIACSSRPREEQLAAIVELALSRGMAAVDMEACAKVLDLKLNWCFTCRRCEQRLPSQAMKSGTVCWECYDG